MTEWELTLRNATYQLFVTLGRAPTASEVAMQLEASRDDVVGGWRRLHEAHALVLNAQMVELRMANPFSAVPTAYRVRAGERWWYGNCAWDAVGICAALGCNGRIETSCPDCGGPIGITVEERRCERSDLLFHCLVPAARWWEDIGFT